MFASLQILSFSEKKGGNLCDNKMTECAVCFQVFLVLFIIVYLFVCLVMFYYINLFSEGSGEASVSLWRPLMLLVPGFLQVSHHSYINTSKIITRQAYLISFGHPKCKTVRVKS